jgi:hypothetical protein
MLTVYSYWVDTIISGVYFDTFTRKWQNWMICRWSDGDISKPYTLVTTEVNVVLQWLHSVFVKHWHNKISISNSDVASFGVSSVVYFSWIETFITKYESQKIYPCRVNMVINRIARLQFLLNKLLLKERPIRQYWKRHRLAFIEPVKVYFIVDIPSHVDMHEQTIYWLPISCYDIR